MTSLLPRLALLLLLLLTAACVAPGPVHRVQLDAYADTGLPVAATYVLVPEDDGVDTSTLRYREIEGLVERALDGRGLRRVEAGADLRVTLGWGLDELDEQLVVVEEPELGVIQGGSARYNERAFGSGERYTAFGRSTGVPTYQIVGKRRRVELRERHMRWVRLMADDLRGDEERPAWEVTALNVSASSDLRRVLPVLLTAAGEQVGLNPGRRLDVELAEGDPRVLTVRGVDPETDAGADAETRVDVSGG